MDHQWLDRTEYPFTSHYYRVNGHHLHYIDEGAGETILFIHGTPSWSFDFRHCIRELSQGYRCIAIDHMGFGLSDKPKSYDYSTLNHSRTLEKFIMDEGLKEMTLVAHDFGGPIGLNFAIAHPSLVKRMVILNSWLWSSRTDPDFIKMNKILKSPILPFLYRYLNFSPRFILPGSFGDHKLSKAILKQYTRPFGKPGERNGALAFAKSLLNDQDWFESLWQKKGAIEQKPTLLIWGLKDPVIKPHNLEKFISGFPNADVVRLDRCGHFPQEEDPVRVTQAILHFLSVGNSME